MTKANKQRYDLYLNTQETGIIKAAEVVLLESSGQLMKMGFRYTEAFREHPHAFSLEPVHLPLTSNEVEFQCAGGIPGILDDYLPDEWGRKVLATLAFYRDKRKLDRHSAIDMLSQLSNSRIGALQWTLSDEEPDYGMGCDIQFIKRAEMAAQSVDDPESISEHLDEVSLLYLANAGTGVGGARPKALLYEKDISYLAKFNRHSHDPYNNAKIELACLHMAKEAGLHVHQGKVRSGINDRDVLLLERFDVVKNNTNNYTRRHLVTINSLLKNRETQRDRGGVFRYDDIADIVRIHSIYIEKDLTQLLRLMLFNRAINNIDDHERNFSLIYDGEGYCMAPAYDLVPSLTMGAYPVAGFQYSPTAPKPSEITSKGKIFGLPKTVVKQIADEVINAVEQWQDWAQEYDVSDEDISSVSNVLQI
ncbi:MAG: type II toxin-antitoxin system HipA family toxin [Gammaproteobacteria bacterium]|nr:type II toxin-antitoxin system HipA family toxin [Gammaproteobacteria bacterium]